MSEARKKFSSVDEYIESFPSEIRRKLKELRKFIKKQAPEAEEKISYNIPFYELNGRLIYFAGFRNHISVYPYPSGVTQFQKAAKEYKTSTGTIQFPHDKEIPYPLVEKMIKYRMKVNLKLAKPKPK